MIKMHAALVIRAAENHDKLMMVKLSKKDNPYWFFRGEVPKGATSAFSLGAMMNILNIHPVHIKAKNCFEVQTDKFCVSCLVINHDYLVEFVRNLAPSLGCKYVIVDRAEVEDTARSRIFLEAIDLDILRAIPT